jgi:hypothetical protein
MIVRILGEGQRTVADGELDGLNALDALLDKVRAVGAPLPDEELVPSDLVLPSSDASLDEVRELLGDEGLIPG